MNTINFIGIGVSKVLNFCPCGILIEGGGSVLKVIPPFGGLSLPPWYPPKKEILAAQARNLLKNFSLMEYSSLWTNSFVLGEGYKN